MADPTRTTRLVPLAGAHNFRDLGGYPTSDGWVTRWRRVFRSDQLHELTGDDLEQLLALGVRTVVDLRTSTEVERDGRGPLSGAPVTFHNLSVLPEDAEEARRIPRDQGMAARYLGFLEVGAEAVVRALRVIADPGAHPVVLHCTVGKDRTGVVVAALLGCLDVDVEAIAADYAVTSERLDPLLERLRAHPVYGESVAKAPREQFLAEPETMLEFLERVRERFGGMAQWALDAGLTAGELDALRTSLLAPPGT